MIKTALLIMVISVGNGGGIETREVSTMEACMQMAAEFNKTMDITSVWPYARCIKIEE